MSQNPRHKGDVQVVKDISLKAGEVVCSAVPGEAWKQDSWEQEKVIHKTVSINPISPNFTNIKSSQYAAGGDEDHRWHSRHLVLSFTGSLSSVCDGFMTFVFLSDTAAVLVGGVFCLSFIIYFHFGIS